MRGIYFDYAATTPVASEIFESMKPYFKEKYGNPGSLHSFGQEAIAATDASREIIAKTLGADFREIVFTGSATEANNLALRGVFKSNKSHKSNKPYRIIVSAIEHESVLETARALEREGVEIVYLPVNKEGLVDLKVLKKSLNDRTILVSIMYANNETGVVQPIQEIAKIVHDFRDAKLSRFHRGLSTKSEQMHANLRKKVFVDSNKFAVSHRFPLFHTDAVQAFQYLDCSVKKLGVDLMTLSAHKIYGPKGIGVLYIRNSKHEARNSKQILNSKSQIQNISDFGFRISDLPAVKPLVTGGGQEFGFRSGTENVANIVGFARAVEIAAKNREKESKRMKKLRDYFLKELKKIYPVRGKAPQIEINGREPMLPNILNVYFPGYPANDLLVKLDSLKIAVSAGSACCSRSLEPSYVLKAMGFSNERGRSSLRFSFGRPSDLKEIKDALFRMRKIFDKIQNSAYLFK